MAQRKRKPVVSKRGVRKVVHPSISNRASSVNEEFDVETIVTARSTGVTVSASAQVKVVWLGLREPFIPADSDEAFETSDGMEFGVLK